MNGEHGDISTHNDGDGLMVNYPTVKFFPWNPNMDTSNDKLAERRQTHKVVHPTSFLVAYHHSCKCLTHYFSWDNGVNLHSQTNPSHSVANS